ncbi:MAG: F0F1 ATP synthase subunit B [Alphaproteobacteria bacterium]|nr:F0F1 ATP synthase subunit B [Alphaproteobacteria bacterium]
MFATPEFWVFVAFVIFVGAIAKPVWKALTTSLDDRSAAIQAELDEAQKLREEAQHLLAEYQRKQRDAVGEAEAIIQHAQEEAERFTAKAGEDLQAALARREQQAKDRIAHAEAQATAEVRSAAVDLAVAAAGKLLTEQLDAQKSDELVDAAIKELPDKLH